MVALKGSHWLTRPGLEPVGEMAGFGRVAETVVRSEPGGSVTAGAGFASGSASDPAGGMAGFGSLTWRSSRRYRATVWRSMPSSRAIRRCDQPLRLKVLIACCISILSWFITAIRSGLKPDPGCNDYLTSKWLVLILPLLAGFDCP